MLRNRFPHPYTTSDGEAFITRQMKHDPSQNFAIIDGNDAIGGIGLMLKEDIHRKNAEVGYWLAEPYWGQGILSSLLPRVVQHGFEHFNINRIFAMISHKNPASCKVVEKCGFILEGRFDKTLFKRGEYHDELIYAIRKAR